MRFGSEWCAVAQNVVTSALFRAAESRRVWIARRMLLAGGRACQESRGRGFPEIADSPPFFLPTADESDMLKVDLEACVW